jgi:ankyrin repeat protein
MTSISAAVARLEPTVRDVIAAARRGDLATLNAVLRAHPEAASPRWQDGIGPERIRIETVPLCCVALGVFEGTNKSRNDAQLTRALIQAGADVEFNSGDPLKTAVSYYAQGAVETLLEAGALVDGADGTGVPMAYAMGFGFREIAHTLDHHGAALDMRFAAGLGKLEITRNFVNRDGSLKPEAGRLDDPYENLFRAERTRANLLSQSLYFACTNAHPEVASYLLDLGADVNQEVPGLNQLGGTVLHALTGGVPVGAGGDPHMYDESRVPLAQLLLDRGASTALEDSRFHSTALGWAKHHHNQHMIDLLTPLTPSAI